MAKEDAAVVQAQAAKAMMLVKTMAVMVKKTFRAASLQHGTARASGRPEMSTAATKQEEGGEVVTTKHAAGGEEATAQPIALLLGGTRIAGGFEVSRPDTSQQKTRVHPLAFLSYRCCHAKRLLQTLL